MHAKYILNITALYPPQHSHSILFLCKDGAFQRYTCHQFKPYKTNHNQIYSPILSLNCFNNLINNWVNNNKIMQMLNKIFFLSHSTQGLFTTQFNNIWVWTQRFFFLVIQLPQGDDDLRRALTWNEGNGQPICSNFKLQQPCQKNNAIESILQYPFEFNVSRPRLAEIHVFPFFFFSTPAFVDFSTINSAFIYCLWIHKLHFLLTFLLKISLTVLFTYLKIISL